MGGALLALAAAGHELVAVHLTDGEAGTRQPREGSRRDEARRALEPLGVQLVWGKLPDASLEGETSLAFWLSQTVATGAYDAVFGPHPGDAHPRPRGRRGASALRGRDRAAVVLARLPGEEPVAVGPAAMWLMRANSPYPFTPISTVLLKPDYGDASSSHPGRLERFP